MVPEMGAAVVFCAGKLMLPFPEAPRPIEGLVFVHAYVTPFAMLEEKLNAAVLPWQKLAEAGAFITGFGFTVIWVLTAAPAQAWPFVVRDGVALMVPLMGAVPLLVAAKGGIFPLPETPSPMLLFVFVQVKVVPAWFAPKLSAVLLFPAHKICGVKAFATGVGKTVMSTVSGTPGQATPPLEKAGVTTILALMGPLVVLVEGKDMLPVPLAPKPIVVLLFVQLYTVPAMLFGEEKFKVTVFPEHTC